MTHPLVPHHLSLTTSPTLLNPTVIPELNARLQNWVPPESAPLLNRLKGRKKKKNTPTASAPVKMDANDSVQDILIEIDPQTDPAGKEGGDSKKSFKEMFINGALLSKACYIMTSQGPVLCIDGYDRILAQLKAFDEDENCDGSLVYINSPGGVCSGCFELCEQIKALNLSKPIQFYTDSMVCSAAYAIASSGSGLIGSLTSEIGSIGVAWPRYDITGMMEKEGVIVEIDTSGDQKSFGNAETKMTDAERKNRREKISYLAGLFFNQVAAARSMSAADVENLQAGVYFTPEAIAKGLADGMGGRDLAIARLTALAMGETLTAPASSPLSSTPSPSARKKAPGPTSTKETPMSRLKLRLGASLSAFAMTMAAALCTAQAVDFDKASLKAAVDDETDKYVEDMEDEDVEAMDEEDVDAMDEDEDLKAEDEDKLPESEDKDDTKSASSRIAHRAVAKLKSDQATAAAKPKEGEAANPMKVAKAVMALPLAKTHPSLANTLAFEDGMTVAKATERLEAAESDRTAQASQKSGFKTPDHGVAPNSAVPSGKTDPGAALLAEIDKRQGKAA